MRYERQPQPIPPPPGWRDWEPGDSFDDYSPRPGRERETAARCWLLAGVSVVIVAALYALMLALWWAAPVVHGWLGLGS